jgi:hypothetical protein
LIEDDPLSEIDLDPGKQDLFIEIINQRARVKTVESLSAAWLRSPQD